MRRLALFVVVGAVLGPACTSREAPTEGPAEPPAEPPARTSHASDRVAPAPPDLALAWVRANECGASPPMSLTASDGTGLRLAALEADAVVEGPIAYTELHLQFVNPEPRVLEGRFALQLPPGAALGRFAMKIDERWQEGEVVERRAAQVAYEDFLHRRQDPALLEHDAGNRFEARVFPIPAGGTKELVVAYSQTLSAAREPWVLPICGLPELDELDVRVLVRGTAADDGSPALLEVARRETKLAPKQDLELRTGGRTPPVVRAGELVVARVAPQHTAAAAPIDAIAILFDTSASRALDFDGQVDRLGALVRELAGRHPTAKLRVVGYDQTSEIVFDGALADFGAAALDRLRTRGAFGATDLAGALPQVHGFARVLLVGDGVITAGTAEREALLRSVAATKEHGIQRIDALVDGGLQDRELLADIVRQPAVDGVVVDARASFGHVVDRLARATVSDLRVEVPGATWTWPSTIDGLSEGDELLVYARLPVDAAVRIEIDGTPVIDEDTPVWELPAPLLRRAHAHARIGELQRGLGELGSDAAAEKPARIREIVELSTRERVLSDYTALLVLETEQDYRRHGIERQALGDILVVGERGLDVVQRSLPRGDVDGDDELDAPLALAKKKNAEGWNEDGKAAPTGDLDRTVELDKDVASAAFVPEATVEAPPAAEVPLEAPRPRPDPTMRPPADARDFTGRLESEPRGGGERGPAVVDEPPKADPWDGDFARVMQAIESDRAKDALAIARAWHEQAPGDVLALVALGEAHEALGDPTAAARAYGSLIDLHPSRVDIRRMAGERLERLGAAALPLAIDAFEKAVALRPDHPSGRRLLAYALAKAGRHADAFHTIEAALDERYPAGRFAEVDRILREDLGLLAAAWLRAEPKNEAEIARAVGERRVAIDHRASVRFVLVWETDANDVDLHVWDRKGGHAFFSAKELPSGGQLYADVTTGYGPECFEIEGEPKAGPYRVRAHYYARGPMGYGMGKLQVIEHDGAGALTFGEHPFVIMKDQAHVDLVRWPAP